MQENYLTKLNTYSCFKKTHGKIDIDLCFCNLIKNTKNNIQQINTKILKAFPPRMKARQGSLTLPV